MNEETRILINYRMERSRESLEEAKILLDKGHGNTFVNRLYYACFYAVSALLLTKGLVSAKHAGIRALFHQNFVKPGFVDIELGHLYDILFDNRQKGDYADLVRFDIEEIKDWYERAGEFVAAIDGLINKELKKH